MRSLSQHPLKLALRFGLAAVLLVGASRLRGLAAPQPEPVQKTAGSDQPEKDEPKSKREIKIKWGKFHLDNKTGLYTFLPDASNGVPQVVISEVGEDYQMVADQVVYDEQNDTARGTGNLTFSDTDSTIVGDLIIIDFNERLATITDNVTMTSHGEEDDEEDDSKLPLKDRYRKKKTVVTCDLLNYWYRDKRAESSGNLKFRQGDKWGTATKAIYFEKDDVLHLEGDVHVENKKGEKAQAPQVVIDNKKDTLTANKGGELTFFVEEEEEEEEEKEAAKPKPEAKSEEPPKAGDETPAGE